MTEFEAQVIGEHRDELGEGPVWCPVSGALYWIDGLGRRIHQYAPASGATQSWSLSRLPGSFALRESGGALIAFRNGLALFDFESGAETPIEAGEIDFAEERFNDGKCDRRGRFWVGSMHKGLTDPIGWLYRIDPDRRVHRVQSGVTLSNGIAWSPDNSTMYHCDSRPGIVFAWDYSIETGRIANRRVFIDYTGLPHGPDGCTVDADGFLWVTEIRAGRIARYTPDAKLERIVRTPMMRPTSISFGGANLDRLYITSMRMGVAPDELARNPLYGGLFVAEPGVRGLPEPRFAG